jgi:hypothetical protein
MTRCESDARIDRGDLTWGHLKHWIEQELQGASLDRPSVVNKSMTKRQALDILYAAVLPRDDNAVLGKDSSRPRLDRLLARNVLREVNPSADTQKDGGTT